MERHLPELLLHCIMTVTICHVWIQLYAGNPSQLAQDDKTRRQLRGRQQKLQKKVAMIVLTDLLCWFPFLIICLLHATEVIDATRSYSLFSILVLPINSVINPLLYSEHISRKLFVWESLLGKFINGCVRKCGSRNTVHKGTDSGTEEELSCSVVQSYLVHTTNDQSHGISAANEL